MCTHVFLQVFASADPSLDLHVFDLKGSTVKRKSLQVCRPTYVRIRARNLTDHAFCRFVLQDKEAWLPDGSVFYRQTLKDLDFFACNGTSGNVPVSQLPFPPQGVSRRIRVRLSRGWGPYIPHPLMSLLIVHRRSNFVEIADGCGIIRSWITRCSWELISKDPSSRLLYPPQTFGRVEAQLLRWKRPHLLLRLSARILRQCLECLSRRVPDGVLESACPVVLRVGLVSSATMVVLWSDIWA